MSVGRYVYHVAVRLVYLEADIVLSEAGPLKQVQDSKRPQTKQRSFRGSSVAHNWLVK